MNMEKNKILLSEIDEPFMMLDNKVFRWNSYLDFDFSGMFPTEEYHNNGLCKDYGWRSVMWFGRCSDGVVERRFATKAWPIYMRRCQYEEGGDYHYFFERFEPKAEPQYRYFNVGRRPRGYINGLYELRKKFLRLGRKIDNVVWCRDFKEAMRLSRERDITPLWGKSMLQDLTLEQWREILSYATGVECAALLSVTDEKPINYGLL